MKILTALFFAVTSIAAAQSPEVPHKMEFAGITLIIRDEARREIQKDVDAYTQSPRHYNIKVERAKTYFPIIEKVFREEKVPEDFKYLVLQESALIADAVSTSNAVGFWQFKDFTAIEMGLRVDKQIDERLNIVSSTRAAARYLKKNNAMFNNWLHALQAYQMGAGGAMKAIKDHQSGANRMEITTDTYWYVKKFLAHKIAYEPAVSGKGQIEVMVFEEGNGKSIKQLAKDVSVDEALLAEYNKWAKSGSIPSDRTYAVLIPLSDGKGQPASLPAIASSGHRRETDGRSAAADASVTKKINGVLVIQARSGENAEALAARAGIEVQKFVKWNDLLSSSRNLKEGQFYYLSRKRLRATDDFHKVSPGEDLWTVSQRYGVQLRRLKKFNRLKKGEEIVAGTMLYLASKRPKSKNLETPVKDPLTVDKEEEFSWSATVAAMPSASTTETIFAPKDSVSTAVVNPSDSLKTLQESAFESTTSADTIAAHKLKTIKAHGEHLVQAGQTLYSIAKMYEVSVMDLVDWNDLDLQAGIKPGQLLKLSGTQTISAQDEKPVISSESTRIGDEIVHEVKASDTLYSIARQYEVTIKQLMDWNNKKDFSLAVGEKLKIQQSP